MRKYDVTALGELLIDFTESGMSGQGNQLLEVNPGGAPCNVLSMLTRLGNTTNFIGKIGKDMFGDLLTNALVEVGIGTDGLVTDNEVHTTLAFVHTFPDGDRDFSFYRNPGADMMLSVADINEEQIRDSRLFHFGTLSMTHEGCREATKKAIAIAEEAGCIISFDPNLREPLWDSLDTAKEQILYGMAHCNILKISDNEIQWLTGEEDYDAGVKWIKERFQIPLILVSLGKDGSRAYTDNCKVNIPAVPLPNKIETTGAGDTFCAGILHYVLENGYENLTEDQLKEMGSLAAAAAAIITTRKGALRVMPTREEVEAVMKEYA